MTEQHKARLYGGLFESLVEDVADRFDENAPPQAPEDVRGPLEADQALVIPFLTRPAGKSRHPGR